MALKVHCHGVSRLLALAVFCTMHVLSCVLFTVHMSDSTLDMYIPNPTQYN